MMNVTSHYRPHYNPPYVRNAMRKRSSSSRQVSGSSSQEKKEESQSPPSPPPTSSISEDDSKSTKRQSKLDNTYTIVQEKYVPLSSLQDIIDMINIVYAETSKELKYVVASDMTIRKEDYERLANGSFDGSVEKNVRIRFVYPMVKTESSIFMRAQLVSKDTGDIQLVWMEVGNKDGTCFLKGFTS